jgi:putative Ca2+/H+ antiporter (TMEM165/GDT1 family)
METFLIATGVVALAEIGDKTQLLALILSARFRQPLPIVFGILAATVANHTLAGVLGVWITSLLSADTLRWLVGLSFIAMAAWTLIPDQVDDEESTRSGHGVFITTLIAFFLAEIGDKTQVATVLLAAKYQALFAVVAGTTLGMMIADVPAVLIGDRVARGLPTRAIHGIAAALFAVLGIAALIGVDL